MPAGRVAKGLRWTLAEDEESQALFPDEWSDTRRVGRGEFQTLRCLHVNAKKIINRVRGSFGFELTVNPYRGCTHACV